MANSTILDGIYQGFLGFSMAMLVYRNQCGIKAPLMAPLSQRCNRHHEDDITFLGDRGS